MALRPPQSFAVESYGAEHVALVTPDDAADLATPSRALWVGGGGAVKVTTAGGETVLISGIAAGTLLPLRVVRVWSATTTATLIQSWW